MSTRETDIYWDYQRNVFDKFTEIIEGYGLEEAEDFIADINDDERVDKRTVHMCEGYYDAFRKELEAHDLDCREYDIQRDNEL